MGAFIVQVNSTIARVSDATGVTFRQEDRVGVKADNAAGACFHCAGQ